jgi:hypothetical protein
MVKTLAPPPDWLAQNDYKYLRYLDARGWLHELQKCHRKLLDSRKREAGEPTFREEWGAILGEAAEELVPGFLGPPVVEVVEKADQATLRKIEKPMLILQVWLGANDLQIIDTFKEILRKARETHPRPSLKARKGRF